MMCFKRKLAFIGVLLVFMFMNIYSQQTSITSQYMFNLFLINPAAAGAEGYTSVSLTGREQWVGLTNTPKTHTLCAETRILKNSFIAKALNLRKKFSKKSSSGRVGIGAFIYNDINGPYSRTGFHFAYAYHIPMRQSQLSFGLKVISYQFSVDYDALKLNDKSDPVYVNLDPTKYYVDGAFGLQFTTPFIYAGFSVTDIFQSLIKFGNDGKGELQTMRNYNLIGAYKYEINRFLMVEPSVLMKFSEQGAFQMDIGSRLYYRADYWGGLSYRTGGGNGAIIFLTGMKYKKYYIGYSFDYSFASIQKYTMGTHEFMLGMRFGETARRYKWLNRY